MHELIAWCGFLGAWLLFAGPVYQAAIELEDEEFQREEFGALMDRLDRPARISPWWWLLPPVAYVKHRRASRTFREQVLGSLSHDQAEAFVSYSAKSNGWLMVGLGGLLIAAKETWELVEAMEWAHAWFWALVVLMGFLAIFNTAFMMRRGHDVLGLAGE